MQRVKGRKLIKYGWIALVGVVFLVALRGLMHAYLPDIHDITPLIWGQAFFEGVQAGWLYPVWLPQLWYGFGLPVFQFYTPLYYWVVALWQGLGFNILTATQIVLALSLIGAWWFTYSLAREFLGKVASILSASLFIWAPYYLSLIYMRGAFPEFWALSLVPLLLWSITRLMRVGGRLYFSLSGGVMAILLLSHTLTAGLAIPLVLLYSAYLYWFEEDFRTSLWWPIVAIGLGGLLTAFHWFPAVMLTGHINPNILISGDFAYYNNFPSFNNLINVMSVRAQSWKSLGWIHLGLVLVAIIGFREMLSQLWARRILALTIPIIILLFLVLPYSDFVWNTLPWLEYLQFPSRLLGPTSLLVALLAGVLMESFVHNERAKHYSVVGILILVMIMYWPITSVTPNRFEQEKNLQANDLNVYDYLDKTIFSAQAQKEPDIFFDRGVFSFEYLPRELPIYEAQILAGDTLTEANERYLDGESPRFERIETDSEKIVIETVEEKFVDFTYKIVAEEAGQVRINQFEFPTWEIRLDGQPITTTIEEDEPGQFLDIPQGTHTLTLKFKHLPITIWSRIFSGIILLLSIIGLILFKGAGNPAKLKKYGKKAQNKKGR